MKVIQHTISVGIEEYAALEATYNVGVSSAAADAALRENKLGVYLLDLPNWDDVAVELELTDDAGAPLPKPIPLTEHPGELPIVLELWLGTLGLQTAAGEYFRERLSPNSTTTSKKR